MFLEVKAADIIMLTSPIECRFVYTNTGKARYKALQLSDQNMRFAEIGLFQRYHLSRVKTM